MRLNRTIREHEERFKLASVFKAHLSESVNSMIELSSAQLNLKVGKVVVSPSGKPLDKLMNSKQ